MSQANTEKFWKKVAVPVVAAAIIGSVSYWWRPISSAIESCWHWSLEPVSVSRLWYGILWLCFIAVVLAVGLGLAMLFWKDTHSHYAYQEDHIFNLLWRWNWNGGHLSDPIPYCPVCKRMMRYSEDGKYTGRALVQFECQGCRHPFTFEGDRNEVNKKIRIEIHHRVDTGLWEQAVKQVESNASK